MQNVNEPAQAFFDIRIEPKLDKPILVITHNNEIISPVYYCGKHYHLLTSDDEVLKPQVIHKWAYVDEFFQKLGIPSMDSATRSKIDEQIKQGRKKHNDLADALFETIKEMAERSNRTFKH